MSLTINGLIVNAMRWHAGWSGVWTAEIDYEGEISPSGKVAIVGTTGIALVATVDDERSGTFGEKRFVRVLGGGAGWRKRPRAQHYHSDVGVALAVLVSTTAAEVGEVAVVLTPKTVGIDFARSSKEPASQVFADAGVDWWVGLDGVTRVGTRVPLPAPLSLVVLDWDPQAGTVSFTCDVLVEPGAIILDPRFGSRIVREVDAVVDGGSVTGTLWLGEAAPDAGTVSELVDGLAALSRRATRATYGRLYEYRVIAMAGDRVALQALAEKADGVPDLIPTSVWAGISGYRATLAPGSRVLVGFIGGNPRKPYVAAYEPPEADGWRPLVLEFDALTEIVLGGVTASGVATQTTMATLLTELATLCGLLQAFFNFPGVAAVSGSTAQPAAAAAAALGATALLSSNFSLKVRAA